MSWNRFLALLGCVPQSYLMAVTRIINVKPHCCPLCLDRQRECYFCPVHFPFSLIHFTLGKRILPLPQANLLPSAFVMQIGDWKVHRQRPPKWHKGEIPGTEENSSEDAKEEGKESSLPGHGQRMQADGTPGLEKKSMEQLSCVCVWEEKSIRIRVSDF